MFGSLLLPVGCKRKWLIASGSCTSTHCPEHAETSIGEPLLSWKRSDDGYRDNSQLESVLGILTVDTVAEFLPKRKSTRMRRFDSK